MQKSSLLFLSASVVVLVLSGCGGSAPAPESAPANTTAKPAASSPETGKATTKKTKGVEPESSTPARRRDKE